MNVKFGYGHTLPWCTVVGGGLWVLNKARWLGWLQGKVKSPSSSTSGGDSPEEIGPPTPVTSASSGETPTSVSEAIPVPQQPSQEKPQRPFSLKVRFYIKDFSPGRNLENVMQQYFFFKRLICAFVWLPNIDPVISLFFLMHSIVNESNKKS